MLVIAVLATISVPEPNFWNISAGLSLSFYSGNSESLTSQLGVRVSREKFPTQIRLKASHTYQIVDQTNTTINRLDIYLGYDRYLIPRIEWFVFSSGTSDTPSGIDYRIDFGIGLKYVVYRDAIEKDKRKVDVSVSGAYIYELEKTADVSNSSALSFRFKCKLKPSDDIKFKVVAFYIPAIRDLQNDYRLTFESSLNLSVSKHLDIFLKLEDLYDNIPPENAKRNDFHTFIGVEVH